MLPGPDRKFTATGTTKDGHEVQATFVLNEVITLSLDIWYLEGRGPITRAWKIVFLDAIQDGARTHFSVSNQEYKSRFEERVTTWPKLVTWAIQIVRHGIEVDPFAVNCLR